MSGKRANVFSQGRPEDPYQDRDGPPDPPKRATAAQLASRKIKSVKPRRAAGAPSNMSQSANFGSAPQPSAFGSPAPTDNAASSFNGFGGANSTFGPGATNSFPPAQPAAPSTNFANASFPAFAAGAQSTTAFNPQPPSSTGFNFTSAGSNPFAASAPAPVTNENPPAPAFGGGTSLFGTQPPKNPFGGLGQSTTSAAPSSAMLGTASAAPQTSLFGTISAAPQTSLFGTTNAAPQTSLFGTMSAAPSLSNTPAPASTAPPPFTFGSTAPSAPSTATPATSGMFTAFGASTQTASPAQNNVFNFGSNGPSNGAPSQPAQNNMFGSTMGTSAQGFDSTPATASLPSANLFGFGSTAPKSDAPAPTLFGASSAAAPSTSASATAPASNTYAFGSTASKNDAAYAPTLFGTSATPSHSTLASAPPSNPFANLSAASNSATAQPSLFSSNTTSKAQAKLDPTRDFRPVEQDEDIFKASKTNSSLSLTNPTSTQDKENSFSASKPVEQDESIFKTPKANPFASLTKPASTPAAAPAATPSGFNFLGAAQQQGTSSGDSEQPSNPAKASAAPPTGLFNAFSTPQPTKSTQVQSHAGGLFNTVQPKPGTGLFAQNFPSELSSSNLFKPSGLSSIEPRTTTSTEASKDGQNTPMPNPFNHQPAPVSERPNLFSAPKGVPAVSLAQQLPPLNESAGSSKELELPKVPKVHVPKQWALPGSVAAQGAHGLYQHISDLAAQLQALNDRYRQQLSTLPPTADWSAISLWHYQHAHDIKQKIDNAKKNRATAKGITGNETALSTKRKVNEESYENHSATSTKRARGNDAPATPTPQSVTPAPSLEPTATSTSNMFAKAINGTKASATASAGSSLFAPKTVEKSPVDSLPSGFTPSSSAFNAPGTANAASSSSGFKPSFGSAPTNGFKPTSGSASGGGSFMAQFKKTAKTYDELAAERKAKVMAEDYDSDDETEEEWSARYDKEEAERLAEEKKKVAANAPTFSISASTKSAASTSATAANPFAGLKKPEGVTLAPTASTPRASSPAFSTGSQSVFDGSSTAPTPSNIFGHLSSGPSSSNNQDDSDEEETTHGAATSSADQVVGSTEPTTPPKRKFGESETEDDETHGDTAQRKGQNNGASSKGSLLSRMTRADPEGTDDSQSGASNASVFGQSNGAQTPTSKPFNFFDFSAASSESATAKPDTFGGDQTFKPGTPIKFGEAPVTEKKGSAPVFQFQPATPAPGDFSNTPAKPPPTSLFNFTPSGGGSSLLAANTGLSSASSMPSSVFSSRAGTPLSEADTNASAGENDDEEGGKEAQIDFSQLTEDEIAANDVVFHTEVVIVMHQQVDDGGQKTWAKLARGPLWILKDKTTGKCLVRLRLSNGSTPLNYLILPTVRATISGASKKMVLATRPAKEGGLQQVLYQVRTAEIAEEFATKYNNSLPLQ